MTVTPESNYALIQQLQDLVSSAAEPPSGEEFSYPVVDQAVSSSMWQWITMGVGSGMIDTGGNPYNLVNLSNATNTAQISVSGSTGTANAILRGFFHQLSANKTISLPMPGSTTTYHICLTFDPRNENDVLGPVSVEVYSGEPPTTFNRHHIVLWTVRRQPNQLLTDAEFTSMRPRVAPTLLVEWPSRLPRPEAMPWGTLCFAHATREWYMAVGSTSGSGGPTEWRNLSQPIAEPISLYSFRKAMASDRVPRTLLDDGVVTMSGGFRRTTDEAFTPSGEGWYLGAVAAAHRPDRQVDMPHITYTPTPSVVRVRVETSGAITGFPSSVTNAILLDGLSYPLR